MLPVLPPVGIEPGSLMNLLFHVRFLISHALLIPTKWSMSKNQVMHEQKFKYLLSSTCPLSSDIGIIANFV